jgi:hypothetical protein
LKVNYGQLLNLKIGVWKYRTTLPKNTKTIQQFSEMPFTSCLSIVKGKGRLSNPAGRSQNEKFAENLENS